ncbi:hypothetical protein B0I35DRAFT_445999 [Stachybotrys elegans]|uniref:Uncharacterized protein n=1 Tax=Stachybotrys elegans TaxID=80388 RepID=A0A8K0WL26_9HYPO|nr:hypothetical protein B0I35DRAFT_445999 [Stachybotrys elegans]
MQLWHLFAILPLPAFATEYGRCTGSQATGNWGSHGICMDYRECNAEGGAYKSGACPNDPNEIRCCVIGFPPESSATNPCGGLSWCDWTTNGCSGSWRTGFCPGGSNFRCCLL